jgi:hypothetical protein
MSFDPTIIPTKAPNIPVAGVNYDQTYENQILNSFRLYFNQIDSFTRSISKVTYGTTANRPAVGLVTGQTYFDTTLGIPIWYNGTKWVNSSGASV